MLHYHSGSWEADYIYTGEERMLRGRDGQEGEMDTSIHFTPLPKHHWNDTKWYKSLRWRTEEIKATKKFLTEQQIDN